MRCFITSTKLRIKTSPPFMPSRVPETSNILKPTSLALKNISDTNRKSVSKKGCGIPSRGIAITFRHDGTMRLLIGLMIAMFGAVSQSSTSSSEVDDILTQLSKIHLDKKQIYNIRDISLPRDALSIALDRGVIAFLEPVNGRVT